MSMEMFDQQQLEYIKDISESLKNINESLACLINNKGDFHLKKNDPLICPRCGGDKVIFQMKSTWERERCECLDCFATFEGREYYE